MTTATLRSSTLIAKAELLKPPAPHPPPGLLPQPAQEVDCGRRVRLGSGRMHGRSEGHGSKNGQTGEKVTVTTDIYGDFWIKNLADGTYTLLIERDGYLTQKLGPIDATEKDRNVGDIAFWKA